MQSILQKIHKQLPDIFFAALFDKYLGTVFSTVGNVSTQELETTTTAVLQMIHSQKKIVEESFHDSEEIREVVFENPNVINIVKLLHKHDLYLYLSFDPSRISLGMAIQAVNSLS